GQGTFDVDGAPQPDDVGSGVVAADASPAGQRSPLVVQFVGSGWLVEIHGPSPTLLLLQAEVPAPRGVTSAPPAYRAHYGADLGLPPRPVGGFAHGRYS